MYKTSGVLTCFNCGKSIIAIRDIPIFYMLFDDASLALKTLSKSLREDPQVETFLKLVLGKSKEPFNQRAHDQPFKLRNVLNYLDNENLTSIFKNFRTDYVNLERFAWKKFQGIHEFLTQEPVETLLDIGCGFGCSTVPFLMSGKAKYCVGIDRSFFFLLLFQRYCQEYGFQNVDLICVNTKKQPFPFKSASFELVFAISFFNYFASTNDRKIINGFFRELDRITTKQGRVYVDKVPNRLNPFLEEVDLSGHMGSKLFEQVAECVCHTLPAKWFPEKLSMNVLWRLYRSYCKLLNVKIEPYDVFLHYVSSNIPEIAVSCLPFSPFAYNRLLGQKFTDTKVIPQRTFYKDYAIRKLSTRDFFKSPYLILYASKLRKLNF